MKLRDVFLPAGDVRHVVYGGFAGVASIVALAPHLQIADRVFLLVLAWGYAAWRLLNIVGRLVWAREDVLRRRNSDIRNGRRSYVADLPIFSLYSAVIYLAAYTRAALPYFWLVLAICMLLVGSLVWFALLTTSDDMPDMVADPGPLEESDLEEKVRRGRRWQMLHLTSLLMWCYSWWHVAS